MSAKTKERALSTFQLYNHFPLVCSQTRVTPIRTVSFFLILLGSGSVGHLVRSYRKIHNLTREFHRMNFTQKTNIGFLRRFRSLNSIAFYLNDRKPRFIYVCVNVAIFNARSRKAIPIESTESCHFFFFFGC